MADSLKPSKAQGPVDKAFLQAAIDLETDVQLLLDHTTKDMLREIDKVVKGGKISDGDTLQRALVRLITGFFADYVDVMVTGQKTVADLMSKRELKATVPLLNQNLLFSQSSEFQKMLRNYPEDVRRRFQFRKLFNDDLTFASRVKTIQAGSAKTVQNIIANGMQNGESAKQIATKIEQYVNPLPGAPKVRPFDEYRKRFGRSTKFTPKGVPAGSVQSNAMRIARTETANTFRIAMLDFYEEKDWVEGWKWVLSGSHPTPDICDDWASVAVYKDRGDVPVGHPHCLCHTQVVIKSRKELRAIARREVKSAA